MPNSSKKSTPRFRSRPQVARTSTKVSPKRSSVERLAMNQSQTTNLSSKITEAIKSLNKRSQDVLVRRFGLKAGRVETLESIGRSKSYGVTRERVRQIEEVASRELRKNFDRLNLASELASVNQIFSNHGNVIKEERLFELFSDSKEYNKENAALVLFMTISGKFQKHLENNDFFKFWSVKNPVYAEKAKNVVSKLKNYFKNNSKVIRADSFFDLYKSKIDQEDIDERHLSSYISISKLFGVNIFGQFGLITLPEINPRGVKDKAYLVMSREGEPKHFTQIAGLITEVKFDNRKANPQTVHNELIKDNRFVLVGRGQYALREWGYEAGTVKDVIVNILKKHGKPMEKDNLIAKVLSARVVKPNTVILNLQNKKVFKKDKSGYYNLVRKA